MKYNPADAAKACNVTVNTIRGWIRDFREHFTPGARGESGNRLLSDRDMSTLKFIASLRLEGLQKDAIAQRLQEVTIGETETLTPIQETAIAPLASQDGLQSPQALVVALEAMQRQIDAIQQARQEDKQIQRDPVQWFGLGFLVAGFLFLGMVLLSWLYGG